MEKTNITYTQANEYLQKGNKSFVNYIIEHGKDSIFEGFSDQDLTDVDFSNTEFYNPKFTSAILNRTNFSKSIFYIESKNSSHIFSDVKKFENVNFNETEFYIVDDFDFPPFPLKIKDVLTDDQYRIYLEENIQTQNTQLESTSKKQINSLVKGFENLEKEYHFEEKFWIRCMTLIAFYLLFLSSLPLLIFLYSYSNIIVIPTFLFFCLYLHLLENLEESKTEKIEKITPGIIFIVFIFLAGMGVIPNIEITEKTNLYIYISPIIILFITLLYFSVTQYSKSKKLRIDNQNKIALIHGMMAIKADTTSMEKGRFYDKIAEIVFDKVHHDKEENLPIDKIIQIIKATNGQK